VLHIIYNVYTYNVHRQTCNTECFMLSAWCKDPAKPCI